MIVAKRIYEPASAEDGVRVLVDRLWPRGLRKDEAHIDLWLKDLAPSHALRTWFGHDEARWPEFKTKYRQELQHEEKALHELRMKARQQKLTLLYAAKDPEHNNAVALKEILAEL